MREGTALLHPSIIEGEIISDRYADVIIEALKDLKYRYGLYEQESIPFLLLDFKVVDFALPLLCIDLSENEWDQLVAQKQTCLQISFRQNRISNALYETTLKLGQSVISKLLFILSEQRDQYPDKEQAFRIVSRLKGMVSNEFMIRNAEMDTPWPYKALCRKLVPGGYWFTEKFSKKDKRIHLK
jgi:hypothetical protein